MRPVALLTVIAALASPAAALADKPSTPPSHPAKPAQAATPTVAYIVKGTVTGYTAANGATNGSLTITVTGSNHHAASMKGKSITLVVTSSTKVALHDGAAVANGDKVLLRFRGPASLLAGAAAPQLTVASLLDQGKAK